MKLSEGLKDLAGILARRGVCPDESCNKRDGHSCAKCWRDKMDAEILATARLNAEEHSKGVKCGDCREYARREDYHEAGSRARLLKGRDVRTDDTCHCPAERTVALMAALGLGEGQG